jgi:S-adenosyl methyltransferase
MTDRSSWPADGRRQVVDIDPNVAHASRVYDYLVGGTDNFAADREAAKYMTSGVSGGIEGAKSTARTNRLFLGQAVRYLAGECGIRQFLDIGPGIPTVNQTHEVAQEVAPESRIVYVDNDPIVLAHAHRLLRSTPEGVAVFIEEDLRNPDRILEQAEATLDFSQPVALMLVAIFHLIPDSDRPYEVTERLVEAVPSGSYLVVSHLTTDLHPDLATSITRLSDRTRESFVSRTRDEFVRFFAGLEFVEPGVAQIDDWLRRGPLPPARDARPSLDDIHPPDDWINTLYAAIGRKP